MMPVEKIRVARLAMLVEECGGVGRLADAVDKSPSQISQWINSSPDSRTKKPRSISNQSARELERKRGKPDGWMDQPVDNDLRKTGESAWGTPKGDHPNTAPGPDIRGYVPLISWVQAGAWSAIIDNLAPGDAEEWLPCPVSHGPRTYVLRVRGESMHNPHGRPSFAEGDLIFIDPDKDALHGSLVVVRLDDDREATFKRLVVEGDRRYLRALNPSWPEPMIQVNGNATFCGVVIGKWEGV
jgi:SOS-response transcriptional repressor LexA